MKKAGRDYGLDILRLICIIMLAVYHFLNYYGSAYTDITSYGRKAILVQNFFWAGGRVICNVFLYISAWYLCEKEFRIERIFKTWFTVFAYSLIIGIVFYIRCKDMTFLIKHFFPISTGIVWYVSMYMGILIITPLLNILLDEKYRKHTRIVVIMFLVMQCVIPSFYAKYSYPGSVLSWFTVAYLMIGIMKKEKVKVPSWIGIIMFALGWGSCLWFYNNYIGWIADPKISEIFAELGMYQGLYFSNLASLPCSIAALGLFIMFQNLQITLTKWRGVLEKVSIASLDVYVFNSMESPWGKLAWVELWKKEYAPTRLLQCYLMIGLGITIGIAVGNLRECLYLRLKDRFYLNKYFDRMEKIICGKQNSKDTSK